MDPYIADLEQQLTASTALVERLREALRGFLGDGQIEEEIRMAREVLAECYTDPLTALREHDQAVRQPLVEALKASNEVLSSPAGIQYGMLAQVDKNKAALAAQEGKE